MAFFSSADTDNSSNGFVFRYVNILRDRPPIGKGAYGEVFFAKCDALLCAAKCVHEYFFQTHQEDPTQSSPIESFTKECEILSSMKHPNIVQYLGYYIDPNTRMPCLLMELMDESLTRFLERLRGPVPFHTSVDFAHDIAMALDYLHNNDIMHRDLSSNNVLLIAGYRAKVSDFGQSTLALPESNYHVRGRKHMCPGTLVYMPPEALQSQPIYSSMLDTFSFGVLLIQILTRLWPKPGESTVPLIGAGPGGTDSVVPVKEVVRRGNHISMINPHHPLLQLALYCIKDAEEERPVFSELCDRISEQKDLPEYKESQIENPSHLGPKPNLPPVGADPVRDQRISELQDNVKQLQSVIDTLDSEMIQLRFAIEKKDAMIEQLGVGRPPVITRDPVPPTYRGTQPPSSHSNPTQASPHLSTPDFKVGTKNLRWYPCTRVPVPLYGGSAVTIRNRLYVNGQGINGVYEFNPEHNTWSELPPAPTASFALVVIEGILTTVGGYTRQSYTNALYSYARGSDRYNWGTVYPPMKEACINAGAVTTDAYLIVAGGETQGPRNRNLSLNVELFQIENRRWFTVDKMPKPAKRISMSVCNGSVYVVGGVTQGNQPLREIFYAEISELNKSSSQQGFSLRGNKNCWKTAYVPLVYSSCITFNDNLLLLGGWDRQPSAAIHAVNIDASSNQISSWTFLGKLPVARFDAMGAVLPGHRFVVIGGRGPTTDQIMNAAEMACPAR